jgi:hypothetical protein
LRLLVGKAWDPKHCKAWIHDGLCAPIAPIEPKILPA